MGKTIEEMKAERGIGGPPLLHGSDVPTKTKSFTVVCAELREAPENFKSMGIMDFAQPVFGKAGMAVNITNLRELATITGFDEPDTADFEEIAAKLKNKKLKLTVALVNNPQIKKMVRSLFFTK